MNTLAIVLALASAGVKQPEPIDVRDVQSAAVFELNLDASDAAPCASILDRGVDGRGAQWCAKAGRRYELGPIERARVLALLASPAALSGGVSGKPTRATKLCSTPRHAVLFQTTKGPRAFDISFECNTLNGRPMPRALAKELAAFMRSFGLVAHLPLFVD